MKLISFLPVVAALAAFVFAGCEKVTEADKAAALETVHANLAAMKARNVEAIGETVHPNSPHFETTKAFAQQQAERYTLLYDLKSAEFESVKRGEIRVRYVLETRKVLGPDDLKDHRETGIRILRRDGAKWKLWGTEVQKTEELGPVSASQP